MTQMTSSGYIRRIMCLPTPFLSLFGLNQWLSSFLMLGPLNPVSHVVVTLKHKTISLPLHTCNLLLLGIVMKIPDVQGI